MIAIHPRRMELRAVVHYKIALFTSVQVSYRSTTQQTATMKMLTNASDIVINSPKSSTSGSSLLMPIWGYHLAAVYLIFISLLGLILNGCFLLFILRDSKVQYFILSVHSISSFFKFKHLIIINRNPFYIVFYLTWFFVMESSVLLGKKK